MAEVLQKLNKWNWNRLNITPKIVSSKGVTGYLYKLPDKTTVVYIPRPATQEKNCPSVPPPAWKLIPLTLKPKQDRPTDQRTNPSERPLKPMLPKMRSHQQGDEPILHGMSHLHLNPPLPHQSHLSTTPPSTPCLLARPRFIIKKLRKDGYKPYGSYCSYCARWNFYKDKMM
jgi:hypothetical protein